MISRLLAGLIGLLAATAASAQDRAIQEKPGQFDFYVLALSWNPSYCATQGANSQQCRQKRSAQRGFVVHGLWPQFTTGYPSSCLNPAPYVPDATLAGMADMMPSKGLVLHEWRKHGTCSGLSPQGYFDLVRRARERIVVPPAFAAPTQTASMTGDAIEAAFRQANPGLAPDMIAVDCGSGLLREVRVCLGKDLAFVSCNEVDRRSCKSRRPLEIPTLH